MQDSICSNIDLWAMEILSDTTTLLPKAHLVEQSSLFGKSSRLVIEEIEPTYITLRQTLEPPHSWEFNVLMLSLILSIGYFIYRYHNVIIQLLGALFVAKPSMQNIEDLPVEYTQFFVKSKLLLILAPSVVATLSIAESYPTLSLGVLPLFLIITSGVVLIYFTKKYLRLLISKFDYMPQRWHTLSFSKGKILSILSLIFAISATLITLFSISKTILLAVAIILSLYYCIKIILTFIAFRFSFFQAILYLCAFEIAPYLIVWGIVSKLIIS